MTDIGQKRITMILYLKRHISLIRSLPFCDGLVDEAMSNAPHGNKLQGQAGKPITSCFESLCRNIQNTLCAFEYQNDIEAICAFEYQNDIEARNRKSLSTYGWPDRTIP